MTGTPDFTAMLAEITEQAESLIQTTGSTPHDASSMLPTPSRPPVVTTSAISADIAAAVEDGCLGMADRRLQRGDLHDAMLWSDLADGH